MVYAAICLVQWRFRIDYMSFAGILLISHPNTHTHTYTHKQLTGTNILKHTYMLTPAVVCSQQLYEFYLCVRFSLVLFFKNCSVVKVTYLLIRFKKAYSFWKHKANWKKRCKWVKIFERVIYDGNKCWPFYRATLNFTNPSPFGVKIWNNPFLGKLRKGPTRTYW